MLGAACALAATTSASRTVRADDPPDAARGMLAQAGDQFVAFDSQEGGASLGTSDIPPHGDVVLAWPLDTTRHVVRNASRLNLVILMHFDPSRLSAQETARAADGVVAFTAVCSHQACWVTDWLPSKQLLQCPCHQSEYDLRQGGKVVSGPAPRGLAGLPLKVADGKLIVAGPFTDHVGGQKL
jgi:rieske iron-sulfur protein